jgi:hypothetical protein
MPNLPISGLPPAGALDGTELFAIVQDGVTKQTTFDEIYIGLTGSFVSSSTFNSYTSSVQSYYLSAYHTASILLSNVGTTYSMSYSTTDFSSGISISGSDKSKIKIEHNGIYDIQFSAQFDKTNSSNAKNYIWLAKNGVNVPDSNTAIVLFGGSNEEALAAWNFYVSASAGDYYQLLVASTNNNTLIQYDATPSGSIPAIPSIILTVGRIA